MSLCGVTAPHEATPTPTGIKTNDACATARMLDNSSSGKPAAGNNGLNSHGSIKSSSNLTGGKQPHTNANSVHAHSPGQSHCNQSRPTNEFRHPGIKYVSTKASTENKQQARQTEVPFAPRPAETVPKSGSQNSSLPYSSFRNPAGTVQPRVHGHPATAAKTSTRKPVPTRPLAATTIKPTHTAEAPTNDQESTARATNISATQCQSPPRQRFSRPEPKKRSHAVMEVSKLVVPKGFLSENNDERTTVDIYAKLPSLWAKTGNPEDIYETRAYPNAKSVWDLTKSLPKQPTIPSVAPEAPGSFSSDESSEAATVVAGRRVTTRSKGASVVDQLYADSRHIGVHGKRARLEYQSTKTRNKLGPLDLAEYRDYRLLPADYFVSPIGGFQSATTKEDDEEEEEEIEETHPDGRPKRRRRQPPKTAESPPPPPPQEKKKRRQLTKTSVFIGSNHQASPGDLPPASKTAYRVDPNTFQDHTNVHVERDEQIWDPKRAAAAEQGGEDIDGFLRPARDVNSQMLLMQALHQANYSVSEAELKFVDLFRASKEPSTELSDQEKAQADAMFETCRKEFGKIARQLNRSVAAVMVQYYLWKSVEKKKGSGAYSRLKNLWKNEEDHCCVCDDGGILIVCEHCHKAYHLDCLNPPLREPPTGDWYCGQCMKSPAKLRRVPSLYSQANSPNDSKPSAQRALPFSPQPHMGPPPLENAKSKCEDDMLIDLTDD